MGARTPAARVARYLHTRSGLTGRDRIAVATNGTGAYADLTVADLEGLLAALADACPDHEACTTCGAHLCDTCGLGEPADCDEGPHCADPECWCRGCHDDAAREFHAEQAADIDRFGEV